MKNIISIIFIFLISQFAFAETYSFTTDVLLIEKDYIVVRPNRTKYMLVNKHSPAHIKLSHDMTTYSEHGQKVYFQMLADIGHIKKAKITMKDNFVKHIIILEMMQ